jgi:UDP-2,3-diacylglucosamine hydrolase
MMTTSIPAGRIFVIGDSHIGLTEGADKPVVEWLERLAALKPRALYLNGDLFHYLIAHPKFRTKAVESVFRKFRELVDRGVAVHYVEGNRDFFLRGSFVEDAVTDVALEYGISAGTSKYLIVHGDMINDRDWPYRFWRRASKNPLVKLAVQLIPGPIARKLVDRVEQRLARSNFKHKSRLPVELMAEYADRRHAEGYTHVVLGHFHNKTIIPANGSTVAVLPAWYESGEAMMIAPDTGAYEFVKV